MTGGTFILGGTFQKNLIKAYRVRLLERVCLFGTRCTKRQDFCAYLIFAVPVAPLPCWPECRWDGRLSDGWVHVEQGPPCEHHLQQPIRQVWSQICV